MSGWTWRFDAACRDIGGEIFYPHEGGNPQPAKDICKPCPVKKECLLEALTFNDQFGVWGGLDPRERQALRRKAAQA